MTQPRSSLHWLNASDLLSPRTGWAIEQVEKAILGWGLQSLASFGRGKLGAPMVGCGESCSFFAIACSYPGSRCAWRRGPGRAMGGITISSNSWGLADMKHVRKPRCNGGLGGENLQSPECQDPTNYRMIVLDIQARVKDLKLQWPLKC